MPRLPCGTLHPLIREDTAVSPANKPSHTQPSLFLHRKKLFCDRRRIPVRRGSWMAARCSLRQPQSGPQVRVRSSGPQLRPRTEASGANSLLAASSVLPLSASNEARDANPRFLPCNEEHMAPLPPLPCSDSRLFPPLHALRATRSSFHANPPRWPLQPQPTAIVV